ncbi:hypothetical protein FMM75_23300 [Lachnospiraceae bacterium MD335]|nr:hypothetical protein [Lachnospiraceae bacterium MD335]
MINIFILELVKEIWRPESELYKKIYNENVNKNVHILYSEIIAEINRKAVKGINDGIYVENILETMGCTYCNKNGSFCGCSMCDWDSLYISLMAQMNVLRSKDVKLYTKAVCYSFKIVRGENVIGNAIEEIAIHNAFCSWQMPDELLKELFKDNVIYKRNPAVGILQARADSICVERIRLWKKNFAKVISISIGVETGNEWIRNHWLNKNISNKQIIEALHLIKSEGANTNANVLLGIPGYTEKQSIVEFEDTIGWLYNNNDIDLITVSPLVTRRKTIQGMLHNGNKHKKNAEPIMLISMFMALYIVLCKYPGIENKIVLSPPNCKSFFDQEYIYNDGKYTDLENEILLFLQSLTNMRESKRIKQITSMEIIKNPIYVEYYESVQKQRGKEYEQLQLYECAKHLACKIWDDENYNKITKFKEELTER